MNLVGKLASGIVPCFLRSESFDAVYQEVALLSSEATLVEVRYQRKGPGLITPLLKLPWSVEFRAR